MSRKLLFIVFALLIFVGGIGVFAQENVPEQPMPIAAGLCYSLDQGEGVCIVFDDGSILQIASGGDGEYSNPLISSDRSKIAYNGGPDIFVYDLITGDERLVYECPLGNDCPFVFWVDDHTLGGSEVRPSDGGSEMLSRAYIISLEGVMGMVDFSGATELDEGWQFQPHFEGTDGRYIVQRNWLYVGDQMWDLGLSDFEALSPFPGPMWLQDGSVLFSFYLSDGSGKGLWRFYPDGVHEVHEQGVRWTSLVDSWLPRQ